MKKNILLSIVVFAILTRVAIPPLFGHLPNFSALDALALFCGAYCEKRWAAVLIAVASAWMGDVLLTHTLFYEGWYWQYGCYALIALMGAGWIPVFAGMTRGTTTIVATSFAAAVLFFVITNFGVWFSGTMYPHTVDGLIACYIAAIPFFKYTLMSDLLFCIVFFGSFRFTFYHNQTLPIRRNIRS